VADTSGQVKDISVSVDTTHTYIGDLVVKLVSPFGKTVDLHCRTGGTAENIIRTYTISTFPDLDTMRNETIEGEWKLKVADLEGQDLGKLNRWGLKITR
jgi:subtilisin-like proprotein convertase family protein